MTNYALPPTEQLLAFKAVVDLGSFTAAASRLSLTQSAVSHQLRKLERRLGVRLITRQSRSHALTDAGEALYAAISDPLSLLANAFEERSARRDRGRLCIQVEPLFAAAWLAPRLPQFLGWFPALQLRQMRSSDAHLSDPYELAIKWGSGRWPQCASEPLMTVDYTPVCAPMFMRGPRPLRSVDQLRTYPLLHDRQINDWQKWFDLAGLNPRYAREGHMADDTNIILSMAVSGQGIALANPQLLQRDIARGDLVLPFPQIRLTVEAAYHVVRRSQTRLSEHAEAFIAWLRQKVRDDPDAIIPARNPPAAR